MFLVVVVLYLGFREVVSYLIFCFFFFFFCFFFFQAEDGIRDLVRSRGLGDVYTRHIQNKQKIDI